MNFATKTELLPHQVEAVAKLLPTRVGGLFMDMGTGKSRTAIELARLRQAKIDRVIWFCPVSIKATIRYQILTHTDTPASDVCVFDDRITERTTPAAQWYIVGIESMSNSARVILSAFNLVTPDSMVIVDESTFVKGHKAKRTQRITHLAQDCRYRLILTGTPFTQGAVDLYAQMRFLSPKILGYSSWYSFAANHIQWSDRYRGKIESTLNSEWLAAKIRPYVYQVTKEECLTLPVKRYASRICDLTPQQWDAYEQAKVVFAEEMMLEEMEMAAHPQGLQSSVPIFRLFTALQGIVCGFYAERRLPHNRLDLLLSVLDGLPDQRVVIWAKYRISTEEIVAALTDRYGTDQVCEYHGSLRPTKREAELQRWRESGQFLVARQSVGAYGLDLTAAHYVLFYANSFKYSERIQAEDRCHRLGQTEPVTYIDLWAECKIEDRIAAALASKSSVLRDFRAEVDKVKAGRKHHLRQRLQEVI